MGLSGGLQLHKINIGKAFEYYFAKLIVLSFNSTFKNDQSFESKILNTV